MVLLNTEKSINYILLIVILAGMFYLLSPFVLAMAVGAIVAVAIDPLNKRLIRWGVSENLSAFFIVTVFSLVFLIPLSLVVIKGSSALMDFFKEKEFIGALERSFINLGAFLPQQVSSSLDLAMENLTQFVFVLFQKFLQGVPRLILGIIVTLLSVYFVLSGSGLLYKKLQKYSPLSENKMKALARAVRKSCNTVILTNVVGGGVQAFLFMLGGIFMETPQVFLLAFVVFLLSFVPMVGTAPVTIILALSQFIDGYIGHGIAWIIIGSVAGVSDNVVKPFVIRSGVNIHPFLGLLSVLGGMTLLGVPGLFLGPFIAGLFTTCTPILWDVDR